MRKTLLFSIVIILASLSAAAATDTTRILFIGNSFIYTFDVPGIFKSLADAAGEPVVYAQHTPGGISVGDTSQGTQAHMNNPAVFSLIKQGGWDYVVLQDNQGRFVYNYGLFPTSSLVIEGHKKIRDSVLFYNPCAHMLWFAGWAFKAGYPPYGNNGDEMIDRIYANYHYLNDTLPEIILPIGAAWKRAEVQIPAIDLYGPDGAHQSLAGSYVTASVIYSTIFKKSPEPLLPTAGLDSMAAHTYRKVAFETVRDSVTPTNLVSCTPSLTYTGNLLTAQAGYSAYQWLKDTTALGAGTSNTYNVTGPACYQVLGTTTAGCTMRSMQVCDGTLNIEDVGDQSGFSVFPNPVQGSFTLNADMPGRKLISITDAVGKVVHAKQIETNQSSVNTEGWHSGVYILHLKVGDKVLTLKIVKL